MDDSFSYLRLAIDANWPPQSSPVKRDIGNQGNLENHPYQNHRFLAYFGNMENKTLDELTNASNILSDDLSVKPDEKDLEKNKRFDLVITVRTRKLNTPLYSPKKGSSTGGSAIIKLRELGADPGEKRTTQLLPEQRKTSSAATRLDNLSLQSISLNSSPSQYRKYGDCTFIPSRDTETRKDTLYFHSENPSQNTIFSTRENQEDQVLLESIKTLDPVSSASTLSRRKAIRSKKGLVYYRIKVFFARFLNKMKNLRGGPIPASSKRTGSIKRKMYRQQTLKRKFRLNTRNRSIKAADIHHQTPLYEVSPFTDQINIDGFKSPKSSTTPDGKADSNDNIYQPLDPRGVKLEYGANNNNEQHRPLSAYVANTNDQNHGTVLLPDHHISRHHANMKPVAPIDRKLQELQEGSYSKTLEANQRDKLVRLWRNYLCHVLRRRIQLRQEILLFESLAQAHSSSGSVSGAPRAGTGLSDVSVTLNNSLSARKPSKPNDDDDKIPYNEDLINHGFLKYYHRNSVMNDMLDDSSDNDSVTKLSDFNDTPRNGIMTDSMSALSINA